MAYLITKTDGTTLTTVADNTVDTVTDLTLIGKNYFNYGLHQNQNYVRLLENFANTSAPTKPLTGQLWYDKTSTVAKLKVYDGSRFKEVGGAYVAASEPSAYWKDGDLWLKTSTGQLYVKSQGSAVTSAARLVGPIADPGLGKNGQEHATTLDTQPSPGTHELVSMYVGGSQVAIFSEDNYTPASLTGYPEVVIGLTMSTTSQLYLANNDGFLIGDVAQGAVKTGTGYITVANTENSGTVYLEAKSSSGQANRVLTVKGVGLTSSSGYVGINTTTPTSALDVSGVVKTNSGFVSTNNTGLTLGTTGNGTINVSSNRLTLSNSVAGAAIVLTTNAGNILIGGTTSPTGAENNLVMFDGVIPSSAVPGAALFYVSGGEMNVMDSAGNATQISPHNFSLIPNGPSEPMAWSYYSENNGTKINVDMLKLARLLEQLTGEKLVYIEQAGKQ
jgi:hypothetical protein